MMRKIDKNELVQFAQLLSDNDLPDSDIHRVYWYRLSGIWQDGQLVSAAGLEVCGNALLLRSVVTDANWRGRNFAGQLVESLHTAAWLGGHVATWLLTTDADRYFTDHHGYQQVERVSAPPGIAKSTQFTSLCPDNARLLRRSRQPGHMAQNDP